MADRGGIDFSWTPAIKLFTARLRNRFRQMDPEDVLHGSFEEANQRASVFLDRWVQENFRTGGANVGGWPDFKIGGRYVGRGKTRRLDTSAKLLMDTGQLRLSFLPFYNKTDAGIGSNLDYSLIHEKGAPARGIPARRILPRHSDVDNDIFRIYGKHVARLCRKPL